MHAHVFFLNHLLKELPWRLLSLSQCSQVLNPQFSPPSSFTFRILWEATNILRIGRGIKMFTVISFSSFSSSLHLFTRWNKPFNQAHTLLVYVSIFKNLHFFLQRRWGSLFYFHMSQIVIFRPVKCIKSASAKRKLQADHNCTKNRSWGKHFHLLPPHLHICAHALLLPITTAKCPRTLAKARPSSGAILFSHRHLSRFFLLLFL